MKSVIFDIVISAIDLLVSFMRDNPEESDEVRGFILEEIERLHADVMVLDAKEAAELDGE